MHGKAHSTAYVYVPIYVCLFDFSLVAVCFNLCVNLAMLGALVLLISMLFNIIVSITPAIVHVRSFLCPPIMILITL